MGVRKAASFVISLVLIHCALAAPAVASAQGMSGDGGVKDVALVRCINDRLKSSGNFLSGSKATDAQIVTVDGLSCAGRGITDLSGIEQFKSMRRVLDISNNPISDIGLIAELPDLYGLVASNTRISNLEPIGKLKRLNQVTLDNNQITDPSPLSGATALESIDLANNYIFDAGSLMQLPKLASLSLENNKISDVSSYATKDWGQLNLSGNDLSDISAFSRLRYANTILLADNHIQNISPLAAISRESSSFINLSGQTLSRDYATAGSPVNVDITGFDGRPMSSDSNASVSVQPGKDVHIDRQKGAVTYPGYGRYFVTVSNGSTCHGFSPGVRCYSASFEQQINEPFKIISLKSNSGDGGYETKGTDERGFADLQNIKFKREDYLMESWNTKPDGSGERYELNSTIKPNRDLDLYAQWVVDTRPIFIITYDANGGGNSPAPRKVREGDDSNIPPEIPHRDGFDFVSWNTNKDGSGLSYSSDSLLGGFIRGVTQNVTLYAQWRKFFTLIYDANGGNSAPDAEKIYPGEDHVVPKDGPERKWYTFDSWNTEKDGSGTKYISYPFYKIFSSNIPLAGKDITSDITLYAQWKKNWPFPSFKLSFDVAGGSYSAHESQTYDLDSVVVLPSDAPTRENYKFTGWKITGEKTIQPGETFTMPEHDVTVIAQWQSNPPEQSNPSAEPDPVPTLSGPVAPSSTPTEGPSAPPSSAVTPMTPEPSSSEIATMEPSPTPKTTQSTAKNVTFPVEENAETNRQPTSGVAEPAASETKSADQLSQKSVSVPDGSDGENLGNSGLASGKPQGRVTGSEWPLDAAGGASVRAGGENLLMSAGTITGIVLLIFGSCILIIRKARQRQK